MSDDVKRYARKVRGALYEDRTLEIPDHAWCVSMVEKHLAAARAAVPKKTHEAIVAELLRRIRPLATRAR
jgi:hypothetical protein